MAGITLDYAYTYSSPSAVTHTADGPNLSLSTSGFGATPDLFFRGKIAQPRMIGDLLLSLVRVVQSRFCLPPAMIAKIRALADPVITCGEDRIRFEAFSACCSVYARVDLLPEAVDGSLVATGTTNVDFNPGMRAALAQLRDSEPAGFTVGATEFALESGGATTIERKVKLPVRWLKGFVEAQAHQSRMEPRFEIKGVEVRRFVQGLPRAGSSGRPAFVVGAGSGLRLSMIGDRKAIRVGGVERLRLLEESLRHAKTLRVYSSADGVVSAWEMDCGTARITIVLSPDVWRGFSGEGQVLQTLAEELPEESLERVRNAMNWSPRVDVGSLSGVCSLEPTAIRSALARLGARGLAGFDLADGAYFRRELPFDLSLVEKLQPRLIAARKLIADNLVQVVKNTPDLVEAWVQGTGCEHRVVLTPDGNRCTCPWYAKHPEDRGPCKHLLAVQIATGDSDDA